MYRFKSQATGDILMLAPQGDAVMKLLGREPAPKGIIEVMHMPGVIAALERAAEEDARPREEAEGTDDAPQDRVSLRQRVWPLIDMLKVAHAADVPVVWGV